jgi:hypothetical protein
MDTLDLELDAPHGLELEMFRTVGRGKMRLEFGEVRELTRDDLASAAEDRGTKNSPMKRLTDRHHAVARLLAGGKKPIEVAAIVGYDIGRIYMLQADPSFKQLLAFYRESIDAEYMQMHEQLAGMSLDALGILRERLEDTPADFGAGMLLELVKVGADRTGAGPTSKSEININVGLAGRLDAARKRVAEKMIDVTPEKAA